MGDIFDKVAASSGDIFDKVAQAPNAGLAAPARPPNPILTAPEESGLETGPLLSSEDVKNSRPSVVPFVGDPAARRAFAREIHSAASTVTGIPSSIYHAISEPPQNDEERAVVGTGGSDIPAPIRLAAYRSVKPIANAVEDYAGGKVSPEAALDVAPEAVGQGAGNVVAGKLMESTAPAAEKVSPYVKPTVQAAGDIAAAPIRGVMRRWLGFDPVRVWEKASGRFDKPEPPVFPSSEVTANVPQVIQDAAGLRNPPPTTPRPLGEELGTITRPVGHELSDIPVNTPPQADVLATVRPVRSGALTETNTPSARPGSQTGEALETLPTPTQPRPPRPLPNWKTNPSPGTPVPAILDREVPAPIQQAATPIEPPTVPAPIEAATRPRADLMEDKAIEDAIRNSPEGDTSIEAERRLGNREAEKALPSRRESHPGMKEPMGTPVKFTKTPAAKKVTPSGDLTKVLEDSVAAATKKNMTASDAFIKMADTTEAAAAKVKDALPETYNKLMAQAKALRERATKGK